MSEKADERRAAIVAAQAAREAAEREALGLAGTRAPRSKIGTRARSSKRPRGWPPRPSGEI
jgi:hypothetical protein